MVTTKQILQEARALLARGWCQGYFAKDEAGHNVTENDPGAVCWCAVGATLRAAHVLRFDNSEALLALRVLGAEIRSWVIPNWNDAEGRTKEEVLAAFDRAIEAAT